MDWNDLKGYIGAGEDDNEFVKTCFDTASVLLLDATRRTFRPVPQDVMDMMILEVGHELYNRKSQPSSSSMFVSYDGGSVPVRGPRDPLSMVRPILATYVVPF